MQKDLTKAMGISGAGLLYHLNILEEEELIIKKPVITVGSVTLKEISINPSKRQMVRKILDIKTEGYTLITGFGKDSSLNLSYMLPIKAGRLLEEEGYNIKRVVAFITPESNLEAATRLIKIDREINKPYSLYRTHESDLMDNLESIIREEQKNMDLILDLTPLTKLLTVKLLMLSFKYDIPSFYLGLRDDDSNYLIWLN